VNRVASDFNYIACFLTFACPYDCWFCINRESGLAPRKMLPAGKWVDFINNLDTKIPVTLQGGEPTMHPGFYDIVNQTSQPIDLLTNLSFDADAFIANVNPKRFFRHAPFAPIRVSYYDHSVDFGEFAAKCRKLMDAGFDLFVYSIDFPDSPPERAADLKRRFAERGIEHRMKPFLGFYGGQLHPPDGYLFEEGVSRTVSRKCQCRTTEILVAPDGAMFRCHADLYANVNPVAHVDNPAEAFEFKYRPCDRFGQCNPCDLKVKNNRQEQFGHCAVSIQDIESPE
jgi:hypothetical protein